MCYSCCVDTDYKFRDTEEANAEEPHKHSVLAQFMTKLRKAGAYAFEDFRDKELKLLLRWSEYGELDNLVGLKGHGGSPQSVAFFSGRQSVFEEISKAAVAILDEREAAKSKKGDGEDGN